MTNASENGTRRRSRRWQLTVGAVVGAGALGVAGIALASIPAADGVIHGCYHTTNGNLRVVDDATTASCRTGETAIQWNQTGPEGPQGVPGPAGPQGPAATSLWAVVEPSMDSSGAMELRYHGSHLVSVEGYPETTYAMIFDRDVSRCAYAATGRDRDWDVFATAEPAPGDPRTVVVTMEMQDPNLPGNGMAVRAPFSLVVTC